MTHKMGERGQAVVIGTVLMFGLAIIALAGVQAFVVPQQNAAVAQQHWQAAEQDMLDLRSAIDRVAADESSVKVAVALGRPLPDRPFLIEGAPPRGTLATREVEITIQGPGIDDAPANTDGDNELSTTEGELTYPSVAGPSDLVYTRRGGDWETISKWIGPVSTFTRQDGATASTVLEGGRTIDIVLMYGDVSLSSTDTKLIDIEGYKRSCREVPGTNSLTEIKITRPGPDSPDQTISWESGETKTVCLLTVGLENADISTPPPLLSSAGGNNAASNLINPHGEGAFEVDSYSFVNNQNRFEITWLNNASSSSRTVTAVRIPYNPAPGNNNNEVKVIGPNGTTLGTGEVGEGKISLSSNVTVPAKTSKRIDLELDKVNPNTQVGVYLYFADRDPKFYLISAGTGGPEGGGGDTGGPEGGGGDTGGPEGGGGDTGGPEGGGGDTGGPEGGGGQP